MFAWVFGLKGMLVAVGISAVASFIGGWWVRDAFCDAAAAKLQVANLQTQLKARDEAMADDAKKAAAAAETMAKLQGAIDELENKISVGECFSADDVERLRSLWR